MDSLEMTDADRNLIVKAAAIGRGSHRNYTWHRHDDGYRRRGGWRCHGKTVVLTQAMIPYALGNSNGLFNLGSALSFVQALPPGVYMPYTVNVPGTASGNTPTAASSRKFRRPKR